MKKFLVKILAGGVVLLLLLLCLNWAYISTDYYKNLNDMGKFRNVPEHIDVANFGASHSACAFNWDNYTQFSGMNMALGSQTLVYDEALLNYYLPHFDQNSTVIIEIMYKSLYETEPNTVPYGTNITRYYQILNKDYIKQWNLEDAINYQYIPVLGNRMNALPKIFEEWVLHKKEQSELEKQQSQQQDLTGEPTQVLDGWEKDAMVAEGKRRAASFMEQSGNQEHGEQYQALIRMIEKCQALGIQVVLVTAPILPCNYDGFSDSFLEKFYKDINEISEKYHIDYFDYSQDERFLQDYRMFSDTDHLNGYGSQYFTEQFLEDHADLFSFYEREGK